MKIIYCLFLSFIFTLELTAQAYTLEALPSSFVFPVDIANTGDGRLFIVEKRGRIYILNEDGTKENTPFLNIGSKIRLGSEQGLLGLAFHPSFQENGLFYVNYTDNFDHTNISSFKLPEGTSTVSTLSENNLLRLDQPFGNHNGGCLKFGPDGYLYIGMGDGGSRLDPQNHGQDNRTMLGTMLRVAVDENGGYAIPEDNPFFDDSMIPNEIWATGLRNPWRFSFDRATGDLWIGDVGQDALEEINYVKAGEGSGLDFGWRCWEGNEVLNPSGCAGDSTFYFPIHVYRNDQFVGKSVTGGFVYRGMEIPELVGKYIYGDYESGKIWSLEKLTDGTILNQELLDHRESDISSFGEDKNGELLIVGYHSGKIYRLKSTTTSIRPTLLNSPTLTIAPNPVKGMVNISFEANQSAALLFQIINLKGQVLQKTRMEINKGSQQIQLDTSDLPTGSFILSITDGKSTISKKMFKLN